MKSLTPRQRELLDYLEQEMARTGATPSLRTAARALGISHTAVASLLQALEQKGWIRREGRYSRSIRLLATADSGLPGRRVPIIGRVAAGLPLYAQQEWDGEIVVDGRIYRGDNLFALRVRGDSMRDAGILDRDIAICEPRQFAENGEIVVALLHSEEATVKRFFYRNTHIELHPANAAFPVMRYRLGEVLVQGRVIGIQRTPDQM
ncbi:MAG TPA: transcriptional repressor LexA [Desulfobulbus sp.]|nr:transcriptional repressor LexA [Desulfobulbus sp.]